MKIYTDKELAKQMLETRRDGFTLRRHVARSLKRFAVIFIFLALALAITAWIAVTTWTQAWGAFGLLVGVAYGIFARDRVYLRQHKQTWPFYMKVIDWKKVEEIVNEDTSA